MTVSDTIPRTASSCEDKLTESNVADCIEELCDILRELVITLAPITEGKAGKDDSV